MANDPKLWVLVADEAIAHFFERPKAGTDLVEVQAVADPAAHASNAEFRRDAHGRRAGAGTGSAGNVTTSAGDDQSHLEAGRFARTVVQRLVEAHREQRFDQLRIVAAPRFLGLLRRELPKELNGVVVDELAKDFTHLQARELTDRLFPAAAETGGS